MFDKKEYRKKYYQEHKEQEKINNKKWYKDNIEKVKENQHNYYINQFHISKSHSSSLSSFIICFVESNEVFVSF